MTGDPRREQGSEAERHEGAAVAVHRRRLVYVAAVGLIAVIAFILATRSGAGDDSPATPPTASQRPEHVHGLGVNPRDGALLIATHAGLFRLGTGQSSPVRVGQSSQDTMGFTVLGSDRFIGSGHPGDLEPGPSLLGLIDSRDGGQHWRPVSLAGKADFHLLRAAGARIYGADSTSGRLLFSSDEGRSWAERRPPEGLIDLSVNPVDGRRLVASTQSGLLASADEGRRWKPLGRAPAGLLSWASGQLLFHVDATGRVRESSNGGRTWRARGAVGAQPTVFLAATGRSLYAALPDGTIRASRDGARTWVTRSRL